MLALVFVACLGYASACACPRTTKKAMWAYADNGRGLGSEAKRCRFSSNFCPNFFVAKTESLIIWKVVYRSFSCVLRWD